MGASCAKGSHNAPLSEEQLVDARAAAVAEMGKAFANERRQLEQANERFLGQLSEAKEMITQLEAKELAARASEARRRSKDAGGPGSIAQLDFRFDACILELVFES